MRFAVLGCGSIGRRHLRNLRTLGKTDLVVFDPVFASREAAEREFRIESYASLDAVWAQNPDGALVTAPSNLHLELALSAVRHNCHLFIEKPLSHTLDGVNDLVKMVEQRRLITMVGCNMRFHPGPAVVKRLVDEQTIGDVIAARIQTGSYLPEWRPWLNYRDSYSANAQPAGGALLDCIHEIDLALWYFGPGVVAGAAIKRGSSIGIEVEGLAELFVRHDNGVLTNIHLNFVQRDYRRCCQVIGEKGTIYWDFEYPLVRVYRSKSDVQRYDLAPDWKINQMYMDELSYFLNCVDKGQQTFCTIRDGIAALRIALAAKEIGSAWNSKEQERT